MNTSSKNPKPNCSDSRSVDSSWREGKLSAPNQTPVPLGWVALLTAFACLLLGTPASHAHESPEGCTGSALGINLFTDIVNVHVGDTIRYSATVFNNLPGAPQIACDATGILAGIVTPDGRTNMISLRRTTLLNQQSDFYANVVSYVVRAQDIQTDGTVRATAFDNGNIHQNDTDSRGGGNQGVNTEVNQPCVQLTVQCVGSVGENGAIQFTGTVFNCGNNTLVGVTVTNFVNNGQFTVLFPTNLLRGQIATFSGSWIPSNPCQPSTATLVARGADEFSATPQTVTSSANAACSNVLTPGITVTQNCPVTPASPGGLLTYSGSVQNTGNVTLTNVVVISDRSGTIPVFTAGTLAPGAVATFAGSYTVPADTGCSITTTLTASGSDQCAGTRVTADVRATCPLLTAPAIKVTQLCPPTAPAQGGTLTYTGFVQNTGNITLTNVTVFNDRTGPTPIFIAATLAPGAVANFTGSYTVPSNCCTASSTVRASGQDICTGATVTDTGTATCLVLTSPEIVVTKVCPTKTLEPGDLLKYSGTVRNAGNITLVDVTVTNDQSGTGNFLLGPIILAPGESVSYMGSYIVPPDFCGNDIVTARGFDACTDVPVVDSVTTTCPIVATPRIAVTQDCPTSPTPHGGVFTYSGTVSNPGNVTLTDVFVINSQTTDNTPVIGPLTLAPGASVKFTGSHAAPLICCEITDTLSARGLDRCSGATVTATSTTVCPLLFTQRIQVTLICPANPVAMGDLFVFNGVVSNPGDTILTNVFVMGSQPGNNVPLLGPIELAPGESKPYTGSFVVPLNTCAVTVTATGQNTCAGEAVSNVANCPVTAAPSIALTQICPTNPVGPGGLVVYTGTVRNTGNIGLSNVVVSDNQFAPNTAGLVGYWALDEVGGALAIDASGNANNGNIVNATRAAGALGGALSFNGTGSSIEIPNNASLNFSGVITVAAWIKPQSSAGVQDILEHGYSTSPAAGVFLRINNGRYEVGTWNGSALPIASAAVPGGDIGNFVHLAGVYDGSTWTLYRNGEALNTMASPLGAIPVEASWSIGARAGGGERVFNGVIDDVRLYNRALQVVEILSLANPSVSTSIFTVASLAPGEVASFTGRYTAPINCLTTSTLSTRALSLCGAVVMDTVSSTCPLVTAPSMTVTRTCPPTPVEPGGVLVYGGSIRNTGNSILTNITVRSSQPVPNTIVFVLATLAPGTSASFNSSFNAPLDACSVTSTLIVTAQDGCTGATVTGTETGTCPLVTTPQITVIKACPPASVTPGATLFYSGTVINSGNVTLNNVMVVNNQPAPNSPVFGPITLAPGATANFTGSYIIPADLCAITATVTATGQDNCAGTMVANAYTTTCLVFTSSRLAVTQACPPSAVGPGGLLTYSGSVRNTGDTTLTNIVVTNDRTGATPVFTAASLAPGVIANFTGSYTVPANSGCSSSSTLTARGNDATTACGGTPVIATATASCLLVPTPAIEVTQACPSSPVLPGSILTYTGTVRNAGNVTLSNIVVTNDRNGATPVFTLANLPPGTVAIFSGSYTVSTSGGATSTSTARADSLCGGSVINSASSSCPILSSSGIAVTKACPPLTVTAGGTLVFTGTVTNTGNVTLDNVFVVNNQPSPNTPVLGPITLSPGAGISFSGNYTVPLNACSTTDTLTATGINAITGFAITSAVSVTCPVTTTPPSIAITQNCPAGPVSPGGLLTYNGSISNIGSVTLNNVVVTNDRSGISPVFTAATLAPGATANFTGSYTAPASGDATSTSTVSATTSCGVSVSNSASSTCPILTSPGIAVTMACPPASVSAGGTLVFTGTVTNTGNITLNNVFVLGSQPAPNTPVFGPITLAPGAGITFAGSYTVPLNVCTSTDTLTANGINSSTGLAITSTVPVTCPVTSTPSIAITQNCPAGPVSPGGLLTYSGSISNSGNITLNNVTIVNNQPAPNSPVFGPVTLAPGATANFSGSYTAPLSGNATSTSTVSANSSCGVAVLNSASSTCPVLTSSGIAVTKVCPPLSVAAGGTLTFTGTVTNTGNVTLNNVFVVDNQPVPNTPVLGPITLAPGAGTSFTGSYTVPLDACSASDTLTATGVNSVTAIAVTSTVSVTCPVTTTPNIAVTENCPPSPVPAGSSFVVSGTVTNTGNVTLTNVFVRSNQPVPNTTVLGPITLAPGAGTNYTGNFTVPAGTNTFSSTGAATFGTVSPPAGPLPAGTVTSRFAVGTNFNGVIFADQDKGYAATQFYSIRRDNAANTTFFDTINANGTVTDRFNTGDRNFDSLTFAAPDVGYGSTIFYYLRHDNAGVSTFGSITPGGVVGVVADHKIVGSNFDGLTFSATDVGYGANLFYFVRHDAGGLSTFGTIDPAQGGPVTDRFPVGINFDALAFVSTDVGYGVNLFYYLRHDAAGVSTFGTIDARASFVGPDASRVVDRFVVGTNINEVAFTTTDVGFGPNNFYFLRTAVTTSTNTVSTTVTASGIDTCLARTVTATANCSGLVLQSLLPAAGSGTVALASLQSTPGSPTDDAEYVHSGIGSLITASQSIHPVITSIAPANGMVTVSWSAIPGITYTLQSSDNALKPVWIDIPGNVTASRATASKKDALTPGQNRFYRVMVVQE